MLTITSPPRRATTPPSPAAPGVVLAEQRIVIRDVSWDLYDLLSDAIGERQHVYLAYDGRDCRRSGDSKRNRWSSSIWVRMGPTLRPSQADSCRFGPRRSTGGWPWRIRAMSWFGSNDYAIGPAQS